MPLAALEEEVKTFAWDLFRKKFMNYLDDGISVAQFDPDEVCWPLRWPTNEKPELDPEIAADGFFLLKINDQQFLLTMRKVLIFPLIGAECSGDFSSELLEMTINDDYFFILFVEAEPQKLKLIINQKGRLQYAEKLPTKASRTIVAELLKTAINEKF